MLTNRSLVRTMAVLTGAITGSLYTPAVAHSDVPDLGRSYTQADLDRFITSFGASRSSANFLAEYDFNNDGVINGMDHSVLLNQIRQNNTNVPSNPAAPTGGKKNKRNRNNNAAPLGTTPQGGSANPPSGGGSGQPETPPPTGGDQQPDQPGGQIPGAIVNASVDADFQLTLTDLLTGRKIISPNNSRLWEPEEVSRKPAQRPTITVTNTGDGFDVNYHFHNTTNQRKSLGRIILGGIRFNESIKTRDFFYEGKEQTIRHNNRPYFDGGGCYPDQYYSPVVILQDAPYTMGISINYDLLKYKHRVYLRMESPGGQYRQGGPNWSLRAGLNPEDNYAEEGELLPGEQRTYSMSVRILKDKPDQWIRTIAPYRDFYRTTYGPVRYVRDERPVKVITTTQPNALTTENPYGYVSPYGGPQASSLRVDKFGWGPFIEEWNSEVDQGWKRFMVWTPSGLYRNNVQNNYPFQFTSEWRRMQPVMASLNQLKAFASNPETEFGLWWGRCGQVMRQWDTPSFEWFDPSKSGHVAEALEELQLPKQINVDTIGLDTFCVIPVWKAVPWLERMQAAVPTARFIIEPRTCDILHARTAMYVLGTRCNAEDHWTYKEPHYLADFLNPGHETWAFIDAAHIREDLGREPTNDEIRQVMSDFASRGYVPLQDHLFTINESLNATRSWLATVPQDLQIDAPQ